MPADGMDCAPAAALAYIGLGANLGDNLADVLAQACADLAASDGVLALACSPRYRSAPVDAGGPDYLNAVAALRTTLAPHALLALLQAVEQRHGRTRPYRHAPRTLDLDLLWYDGQHIDTPSLIVPHPRMHQRAFVLRPLADLAPAFVLPQGSLAELLRTPDVAAQRLQRLDAEDHPKTGCDGQAASRNSAPEFP